MRAALGLAVGVALLLSGCSARDDDPTVGSVQGTLQAPDRSVPATRPPNAVTSNAVALAELSDFSRTNRRTIQQNRDPGGRAFIDGLVAAGFKRAAMQVTADRTTIGLPAPSVQFSVKWEGVCLIGDYGRESGYDGVIALPVNGACLVGKTRPIDW